MESCLEAQLCGAGGSRERDAAVPIASLVWIFMPDALSYKGYLLRNGQEIWFWATQGFFPSWQRTVWFDYVPFLPSPMNDSRQKPACPTEFLLYELVWIFFLQKHAKGQDLLKKVCDHLNLLEEDYFGLAIWDTPTSRVSSCGCVVFCTRVGSALLKEVHLPWGGGSAWALLKTPFGVVLKKGLKGSSQEAEIVNKWLQECGF